MVRLGRQLASIAACLLHLTSRLKHLARAPHPAPLACRLSCPAFRVPAGLVEAYEGLALAALGALQPARRLRDVVSKAQAQQHLVGGSEAYNVLQLEADDIWAARCAHWQRGGELACPISLRSRPHLLLAGSPAC